MGSQKSKKSNKQMLRRAFEGRHIDQVCACWLCPVLI